MIELDYIKIAKGTENLSRNGSGLLKNLGAGVAEFGRRAGFRIQWAKARGGSNPPFGTINIQAMFSHLEVSLLEV
jgi:hypothetical protein